MKVYIETSIDAPADRVWDVLGRRFAEIDQWTSIVDTSRPLEPEEVPTDVMVAAGAPVPGRETKSRVLTAKEVLVEYSDSDRQFTFDTADLPRVMKSARNRTRVTEVGSDESVVSFDIEIEPDGVMRPFMPILKKRMTRSFGTVQQDLKDHVEATR